MDEGDDTMKLINTQTGQTIELLETNDIQTLENQIKLLGLNGLFYSEIANNIRKKIEKLKGDKK